MNFGDEELERLAARHPVYKNNVMSWVTMQDCFDGELAIKRKGPEYLPMLRDQSSGHYELYKERAYFYNATARVVHGSVGMLLTQGPALFQDETASKHAAVQEWYDSLSGDNAKFSDLLSKICYDFVLKGRVGILVDGTQQKKFFRPRIIRYSAEQIVNWSFGPCENNGAKLQYVVLEEAIYVPVDNTPWIRKEAKQWRVCYLDEQGEYCQAIYRKKEKDEKSGSTSIFVRIQNVEKPTRGGKPLKEIPFWILNYGGDSNEVAKPPLLGLALMNLSHYRTTAILENGRFFAGGPTAVISGANDLGEIRLGTAHAIKLTNPKARVYYLEMSGAGLASLERAQREKELKMAMLGSRILEIERIEGSESAATKKLRRNGEICILASMSSTLSAKLTNVVRFSAWWSLKPDPSKYEVRLIREFNAFQSSAEMIHQIAQLVRDRLISYETLFDILVRMEIIPHHNMEAEMEKIRDGKGSELVLKILKAAQRKQYLKARSNE